MSHNVANCKFCNTGKSGFMFCSGNCNLKKEYILNMLKNGEIQFLNDSHDSEIFCYLTKVNFNGFNYYYTNKSYSGSPFKDIPIVRLSDVF